MILHKDMKRWEMKYFLQEDLKTQIHFEISPILHLGIPEGGYFGVTRQILCLVDFLGALYCGYNGSLYPSGSRKISETPKTINFVNSIFGDFIDPNYSVNSKYLITMYRHGLVHSYQPKIIKLKDSGKILEWLIYKGPRENAKVKELGNNIIKHMCQFQNPKDPNKVYLTISIITLFSDLLSSIDIYTNKLVKDKGLQRKFISTVNALCEPDPEGC